MKKLLNVKNVIAILLILVAFSDEIKSVIPSIPKKPEVVTILNIDKPSDRLVELVSPVSNLVTDPTDRAKLAIYSEEFSKRVKNYDTDLQQVNDVLAASASEFFKDSINDKYVGLDIGIIELIKSATDGDQNHKLSDIEKTEISDRFLSLAWSLIQRK